jgi:hypothetical protein
MEEGPSFLKKLRGMRAEAVLAEQHRLEASMPSPPGLSIADIAVATPSLLAALEHVVAARVRTKPCADSVDIVMGGISMSVDGTEFVIPHKNPFGKDTAWWSAVYEWGANRIPSSSTLARRYKNFVRACYKVVHDVWRNAHPELESYLDAEEGVLSITIPDEVSSSSE